MRGTDRLPVSTESLEAQQSRSAVLELGPVQQAVAQLVNRVRRALRLPSISPQRHIASGKALEHESTAVVVFE